MGKNYHPTLGQASLLYGISEWALEHLVEDHNKRFPDKPIVPLVPATDSPALWNSADIEPLIQRYHLLQDLQQAMVGKELKQLRKAVNEVVTKLELPGQQPETKAIEHQEGVPWKLEKEQRQRERVIEALKKTEGNITKAAQDMDIHRQQFQKLLKKYRLDRQQFIPERLREESHCPDYSSMSFEKAKRVFEVRYLKAVLKANGGNVSEAARASGIARTNLHEKIKKNRINVEAMRERESNTVDCSLFETSGQTKSS